MKKRISKLAKEIFNELGCGFEECIYQKAFEVALRLEGLHYENQKIIPIDYKGYNVGESKPDLIVSTGKEKMIIELKATGSELSPKEETQLRKYLGTLGINKGILINFPQAGRKGVPEEPEIKLVEHQLNGCE